MRLNTGTASTPAARRAAAAPRSSPAVASAIAHPIKLGPYCGARRAYCERTQKTRSKIVVRRSGSTATVSPQATRDWR